MPAVTVSGMLAAEAAAISKGWTEEQLLDLAGKRLGMAIGRFFKHPGSAIGYLGKGHNAGDTLVALGVLRDHFGWKIAIRCAFPPEGLAPLTHKKWQNLGIGQPLAGVPDWRDSDRPLLLLDGLLGTGSRSALADPLLALANEMEWLRNHAGARVAAVDLPSGVDPDTGISSPGAVTADVTFMIGNAKAGLLNGHAANSVGALALVPVECLEVLGDTETELISPQTMNFGKQPRPFDFHKGMAGRVSIIAGSTRYPGAAVIAATGALRGGAGLVTLHVPDNAVAVIASKCPPEIIVRSFPNFARLDPGNNDSMVIGCGLGELASSDGDALLDLITHGSVPSVIDADALNLIASRKQLEILQENHLITPHPGEFRRLAPDLASMPRESAAREFSNRVAATLILKGSRTIVARAHAPLRINSTGGPAMSTGGQGDLLAGVMAASLIGSDEPWQAAALATWVCGRAAELALDGPGISEKSLTPSDVANWLGGAFLDWQSSRR